MVQVPIGLTSSKATRLRPILGTDIMEMQMDGDPDWKKKWQDVLLDVAEVD